MEPEKSSNVEVSTKNGQVNRYLNLVAWICATGSLLSGYATAVINGALPFLADDLGLTPVGEGVVISSYLIGSAFGSLVGGRLADKFGRKRTLIGITLVYLLGTLIVALAPNLELLIAFRILLGLNTGGYSSVIGVMLAELAPAKCRDRMVTRSFLMVMVGEFGAFGANAVLGILWKENTAIWRWMVVLAVVPGLIELALIALFIPESPRWLFNTGRSKEARDTLRRIRKTEAEVDHEFSELEKLGASKGEGGFSSLFTLLRERWFRRSLLIGIGIALCMAAEAGGVIMYYGTLILKETNGNDMQLALLGNTGNGLISLLASCVALLIIGSVPRRPLFIVGLYGAAFPHALIALSCWLLPDGPLKGWLVLAGMLLFLCFQQGPIMNVTWLLLAEMFPLRVRGLAVGLAFWFAWMNNFVTNMLFPLSVQAFGYPITFGIIVAICCTTGTFAVIWVPETYGKSLERLEMEFRGEENSESVVPSDRNDKVVQRL